MKSISPTVTMPVRCAALSLCFGDDSKNRRRTPSHSSEEYDVLNVPPPPRTAHWQKSRASGVSNCVEVARTYDYVWVRDSTRRSAAVLGFTRTEWSAFLEGARCGEFNCPPD